jgi:hypothetical protein
MPAIWAGFGNTYGQNVAIVTISETMSRDLPPKDQKKNVLRVIRHTLSIQVILRSARLREDPLVVARNFAHHVM